MNPPFIQLSKSEVKYLIELINDMDSDTVYTARQRAYTLPKLVNLLNGDERKLYYQDVNYLLELVEDDEFESSIKDQTYGTLQAIQNLQNEKFNEQSNIDEQRTKRRSSRHIKKNVL